VAAITVTVALQTGAIAQTSPNTGPQQVLALAPQLVAFSGSDANFQALVNGLLQGTAVTLTTLTPDGFLQTVTFTPASVMSVTDVARLLEAARQQLISSGIANPTAQQIGVILAGGPLPTPSGTTQVGALVPTLTPAGIQPGLLAGAPRPATPIAGTATPPTNLVVDIRPTTPQPLSTSASTGASTSSTPITSTTSTTAPVVRFTSDNTRLGNTSDTPLPTITPPLNTSASPVPSSSPTINPATGVSNGSPSPAAQMQGRR
jgi:hypothetical protein